MYINNGTKPELTIIITTCYRFDALIRCLDSIKEHAPECSILVMIDDNDIDTYNNLMINKYNGEAILSPIRRECCALTNLGVGHCKNEYFVYLNDDMVLVQKDCFKEALEIFKLKFPDKKGFITFDDGINGGSITTQGLTSKTFVLECLEENSLCNPTYKHYYWDKDQAIRIMNMGKYLYCKHIKIRHDHFAVTKKIDKIYQRSNDDCLKDDEETFKRRNP